MNKLLFVFVLIIAFNAASFPQNKTNEPELPVLRSAPMPLYPPLARQARIEGAAEMKVWTDGASVTKVEGSGAHKMLIEAATENIKTWRFFVHEPMTFTVVFDYKIEPVEVEGPVNPTITLQLPSRVEIRTKQQAVNPTVSN
jgi:outer membrane biosynthesis protein TonB